MLLITLGRFFPKELESEQIFCPHERRVRIGSHIQYLLIVGIFFVPLIPVARLRIWRCQNCHGDVSPNLGGKNNRSAIRGYSVLAFFGFVVFAIFAAVACTIGGKDSAFAQETINVARGLFAFLAGGGVWIIVRARRNIRRITNDLERMTQLSPERLRVIQSKLDTGDDLECVSTKLKENGFSTAEIDTYMNCWCVPEGNIT